MTAGVSWLFDVQLKDGRDGDWRTLMSDMINATKASEPGTVVYEWSSDTTGTQWQIHEGFVDSAAALVHTTAFGTNFASRFFTCVAPQRMVISGAADDALRAALATLRPLYLQGVAGFTR